MILQIWLLICRTDHAFGKLILATYFETSHTGF